MPSSSKHRTCQEQRLYEGFKIVHIHLWYARMNEEADYVTKIFCDLLETTQAQLTHELRTNQGVRSRLEARCKDKSDSDNVCIAADCMADVASCLFGFGRKEEGGQFCEWAEDIRNLAQGLYEEEQAAKARSGRRDSVYAR